MSFGFADFLNTETPFWEEYIMHEIGVVREVVKTVLRYVEEHNVKEVSEIVVDIGELSLIVPKYVEDLYPACVAGTPLEDTKLIINITPGLAICNDCDEIFNVVENKGCCPKCNSFDKDVLSGRDFMIKQIHVPED